MPNRFPPSPSDHLAEVFLLVEAGGAKRKQNRAPNLVQWRGAGNEVLRLCCIWALHKGSAARAPGVLGRMVQRALAGSQGKRLGNITAEDCGFIVSLKPGKTDLTSGTSPVVRLVNTSEQSLLSSSFLREKSTKMSTKQCSS